MRKYINNFPDLKYDGCKNKNLQCLIMIHIIMANPTIGLQQVMIPTLICCSVLFTVWLSSFQFYDRELLYSPLYISDATRCHQSRCFVHRLIVDPISPQTVSISKSPVNDVTTPNDGALVIKATLSELNYELLTHYRNSRLCLWRNSLTHETEMRSDGKNKLLVCKMAFRKSSNYNSYW